MRRYPILVAAFGVLALCGSLVQAVSGIATPTEQTRPTHPRQLSFEPLTYRPPDLRLRSLSNGLRYGILEDSSLPRVEGVLIFEAGSIDDPPEAVGLAEVVGELLRTGGSLTRPAEEVDEEIDFMGASVEVSTGGELTVVRFWALSRDFNRLLALVSDLVRNPAFREDRLVLALDQMRESIRRRWDNPASIASERFADLVYGEKSRWARRPSERTLNQIGQDACRRFYARAFVPARAWLGIAGDVKERAARRSIRQLFGSWNARSIATRKPEVSQGADAGLYWIERDLAQAQISLGHLGALRLGPDHYALKVMNLIVGSGGFASRLMKEVRTARGIAYAVSGRVGEGLDRGLFRVNLQTRPERVPEALEAVQSVFQDVRRMLPGDGELQVARDRVEYSFVFEFSSPAAIVERRLYRLALGYPDDYLDTYLARVMKVDGEAVRRVARTFIQPAGLVTLIVGPEEAVAPLRAAGKVVRKIPLDPGVEDAPAH